MNKQMFKEIINSGIDKFTTSFVVLEKNGESKVRTFSEEFEEENEFYGGIQELKKDGWVVMFCGCEEDVYTARCVTEFEEDIDEVFNRIYGE